MSAYDIFREWESAQREAGSFGRLGSVGSSFTGGKARGLYQLMYEMAKSGAITYDSTPRPDVGGGGGWDDGGARAAQITADAQKAMQSEKLGFARSYLDKLMPGVSASLGGLAGVGAPAISIDDGAVYSPEQLQEQVNLMRAKNDAEAATMANSAASSLAGRGFGSSSPLLESLQNQIGRTNLAANSADESNLRYAVSGKNADQKLKAQIARAQAAVDVQQNAFALMSGLFGNLT